MSDRLKQILRKVVGWCVVAGLVVGVYFLAEYLLLGNQEEHKMLRRMSHDDPNY